MQQLQSVEQYREMIQHGKNIIMVSAGWCPDCRFIEPFIDEIVETNPEYTFTEINRDKFLELCQEIDVMGIPSFVAYKDGEQIGRFVSGARKTREEIEAFIASLA